MEVFREVESELARVKVSLEERIKFLQTEQVRLNELAEKGDNDVSDYIKELPEILKGIEDDVAHLRYDKVALENGIANLLHSHALMTKNLEKFQGKFEN